MAENGLRGWRNALLAAAAGAVAALGHPPFDLWFLTPLGLAMAVWLFAGTTSLRGAAWCGFWVGFGYFGVALHWIVEPFLVDLARHGWMAPFALVLMASGGAAFWAVAFALAFKLQLGVAGLVFSLTAFELLRAYLFTGFPWAMPSYVLVNQAAGQAASLLGPHGLNAVLLLVAAFGGWAARQRGAARWVAGGLALLGMMTFAVPVASPHAPEPGAPVVRIVQPNAAQHLKWHPDHRWGFFDLAVAMTAAGEPPELVVWPETSVPTILRRAVPEMALVAQAARGAPVVLGLNRYIGERVYNTAVVVDAAGEVSGLYDKHHLVPFGEYIPFGDVLGRFGLRGLASQHGGGYSAGPGPELLNLGELGSALPLICYEAVFPQDTRSAERPRMLLHMTNDAWFGSFSGPFQHLAQARMRAIETGLPVVRAANTGVSAMIDTKGRVTAEIGLNRAGYVDAALPPKNAETLYAKTGDVPIVVMVLMLMIGALALRTLRQR